MSELKKFMPTGYTQNDIYQIVRREWAPHRGFVVDSKEITKDELMKDMQFNEFVVINMHVKSPGASMLAIGQKIQVVILHRIEDTNAITDTNEKFKLFYNSTYVAGSVMFMITPSTFHTPVATYIHEHKINEHLIRYNYDQLKVVMPLTPGCAEKTEILDEKEADAVRAEFQLGKMHMKVYHSNDEALAWVGGSPGQIVRITRASPVGGLAVDYRKIVKASYL